MRVMGEGKYVRKVKPILKNTQKSYLLRFIYKMYLPFCTYYIWLYMIHVFQSKSDFLVASANFQTASSNTSSAYVASAGVVLMAGVAALAVRRTRKARGYVQVSLHI